MTQRTARWIVWILLVVYVSLATVGLTLQAITDTPYVKLGLPVLIFLVSLVGLWMVTGALIISRHPQHPVGWLLCAGLFASAIDMFAAGYAAYETYVYTGSLPGVDLALIWLKLVYLGPHGLVGFTLIVLLFPDGQFPSPGWRKVAWTTVGGGAALVSSFAGIRVRSRRSIHLADARESSRGQCISMVLLESVDVGGVLYPGNMLWSRVCIPDHPAAQFIWRCSAADQVAARPGRSIWDLFGVVYYWYH